MFTRFVFSGISYLNLRVISWVGFPLKVSLITCTLAMQ